MKITIEGQSQTLEVSGVVLLMPQQVYLIENIGNNDLTYYVLKYLAKKPINVEKGLASGGSLILYVDSLIFKQSPRGGSIRYFDRATSMC